MTLERSREEEAVVLRQLRTATVDIQSNPDREASMAERGHPQAGRPDAGKRCRERLGNVEVDAPLGDEDWCGSLAGLDKLEDSAVHAASTSPPEISTGTIAQSTTNSVGPARELSATAIATAAPTPLLRERCDPEPLPRDALGPLREPVHAVETLTSAPAEIALQSVLSVASFGVQRHVDVETLGGPRPTSLFLITVAASGERKSACDSLSTRAVREHERERRRSYPRDFERFQARLETHEAERRQLIRRSADGVIDTQADLEALPATPRPPITPTMLVSDPTLEGVLRHFEDGPGSIGVFSDEGGQLLGGHAMNAENRLKTGGGLSKLWDGDAPNRTRAGEPTQTFDGRRVALHLMIQPRVADDFLADPTLRDQGLLSRCLLAWPASRIGSRMIVEDDDTRRLRDAANDATERFAARVRDLLETPAPTIDGGRENELAPRELPLSDGARSLLVEFANAVEAQQGAGGHLQTVTGVASKAAEQAARIAGVLTIFADLHAPAVSTGTMAKAVRLAAWYLNEAARLLDTGGVCEETMQAETLRRWLVEVSGRESVEVRDIVRLGPGKLRDTALVRRLVPILERNGWLVRVDCAEGATGRKPRETWRVVGS